MFNNFDNIERVVNFKANEKDLKDIQSLIEKLIETKITLEIELSVNNDEKIQSQLETHISSIQKRLTELETIIIPIVNTDKIDESVNDLNLKSNLKLDTDEASADIANVEKNLWELNNEKFGVQVKAFLDDTDIISYVNNFDKYLGGLAESVVKFINNGIENKLAEMKTDYDADIKNLKDYYDAQDELYEEHLANLTEKKKEHDENIDELESERDELEAEKLKIMTEEEHEALQQKIDEKQSQIDLEKDLYDDVEKKHAQTLANQEQADLDYAAEKLRLDNEYNDKKTALETEAAERSKKLSLINAHITLAQSVLGAVNAGMLSGFPLVFVPLYSAMALAMGGMQIATIAQTQIPARAMGGYIGAEYAGNYKALGLTAPNNTDNTLAWLSTGERVLTPQQNYAYERMLHANHTINNSKSDIANTYHVNVNVAKTNSSSKAIAKAVVKAIGGKL